MNLSPKKVFLNTTEIENLVSIRPHRRKLSFPEVMIRFMQSFSTVYRVEFLSFSVSKKYHFEGNWLPFHKTRIFGVFTLF